MSQFVTLAEARAVAEHLIVTDDFVDLANRAAERLYINGASPGFTTEISLASPAADAILSFETDVYNHALAFKVNTVAYSITAIEVTYKEGYKGTNRFIDLGHAGGTTRSYQLPTTLWRTDEDYSSYEITALVRPTYTPVADEADTFPIDNKDALKNAIQSIQYEDNSDLDLAKEYMSYALSNRNADSREFRGPQVVTIAIYDPASAESTSSIN